MLSNQKAKNDHVTKRRKLIGPEKVFKQTT